VVPADLVTAAPSVAELADCAARQLDLCCEPAGSFVLATYDHLYGKDS
jgi:hypothetical protein